MHAALDRPRSVSLPSLCVTRATKLVQSFVFAALSFTYLAHVLHFFSRTFWTRGLGDWIDPYFINALLEHWHRSLWRLSSPASPPMFFPIHGTLGYSHGLVLFAPFYEIARLLFHPFTAYNLTFLLVVECGIV